MPRIKKAIKDAMEGIGVYICTLLGIVIAQYGPMLVGSPISDIVIQWTRLGLSAVIAFYLVIDDENKGDEEGKKNNLKRRLKNAFQEGMTWNVILGIGIEVIKGAGG